MLIKRLLGQPPIDPAAPGVPTDAKGRPLYSRPEYFRTSGCVNVEGNSPQSVAQTVHLIQLAQALQQLQQLSVYSNELFSDLINSAKACNRRMEVIKDRMGLLKKLLPSVEQRMAVQVLADGLGSERQEWRASTTVDQQLFTKSTANVSIKAVYDSQCLAPPDLAKLDKYRDDGQTCMKFYSYPLFFTEQWIALMERQMMEKKDRRHKKNHQRNSQQQIESSQGDIVSIPRNRTREILDGSTDNGLNESSTSVGPVSLPRITQSSSMQLPPPQQQQQQQKRLSFISGFSFKSQTSTPSGQAAASETSTGQSPKLRAPLASHITTTGSSEAERKSFSSALPIPPPPPPFGESRQAIARSPVPPSKMLTKSSSQTPLTNDVNSVGEEIPDMPEDTPSVPHIIVLPPPVVPASDTAKSAFVPPPPPPPPPPPAAAAACSEQSLIGNSVPAAPLAPMAALNNMSLNAAINMLNMPGGPGQPAVSLLRKAPEVTKPAAKDARSDLMAAIRGRNAALKPVKIQQQKAEESSKKMPNDERLADLMMKMQQRREAMEGSDDDIDDEDSEWN